MAGVVLANGANAAESADVSLSIGRHALEIAPNIVIPTTAYNHQVPGPVIRLRKGKRAVLDVTNNTEISELAHWHGLHIPSDVDGAEEQGTPPVLPGRTLRYAFEPKPAGTQWYHTHTMGGANLSVGTYTGLYGFFIIDDGRDKGLYDQEILLSMHHWLPHWESGLHMRPDQPDHGLEVNYRYATMNGRMLGHNDPIKVREGQRVLFRILNADATEMSWTALSGHKMRVIEMDGHPVPTQRDIDVLMLGPGERADVVIEMNRPGVWVMGSAVDDSRKKGLGIVVEYEHAKGAAQWIAPKREWDYLWFGSATPAAEPDERFEFIIDKIAGGATGHNQWTMNGRLWPDIETKRLVKGRRYRLVFKNATDHGHPMHLHRHSFEVASYKGVPSSGLLKDVINVMPGITVELDFVANNPGPTLLHCHQSKHQEFGLMALLLYEGDAVPAAAHKHHN
ncbi:MAG: multicopper oxidase family protein [Rhodospirillaceae bacterium]|nr:multicopper oxidase family protein [Rhodospirillaceae bacterium]